MTVPLRIKTYACETSWGAVCDNINTDGHFSKAEQHLHIKALYLHIKTY